MSQQNKDWFFTAGAGDRLVNGDKPNQNTFQNLTDSTTFKGESGDKATDSSQGLVKIVSDDIAKANTDPDTTWTYAAQPHQLPTVDQDTQSISTINDVPAYSDIIISVVADIGVPTRNHFIAKLKDSFITWIQSNILPRLVKKGGTTGQVLTKVSNTDYDLTWANASIPTGGTTGQILKKNSATNFDASFGNQYPTFAGASKSLVTNATNDGVEWAAPVAQTNIPTGGVIMYAGSSANFDMTGSGTGVCAGWHVCNGGGGTVDLQGTFPVPFKAGDTTFGTLGAVGGSKTITISEANLPPHTHSGTTNSNGDHFHNVNYANNGQTGGTGEDIRSAGGSANTFQTSTNGAHTHTFTTGNGNGTSTAITTLPPYTVIIYMQKL